VVKKSILFISIHIYSITSIQFYSIQSIKARILILSSW